MAAGGEWLACGQADLDGANYFGDVVDVDGGCSGGVETGEEAVEVGRAVGYGALAEAFAVAGLSGGCGEEAVDEGPEVKACATGDDRDTASAGDAGEGLAGLSAIVARGAGFVGPSYVYHVVLDEGALGMRGLGCADLHFAVDRHGVATDDFTVELLGEVQRKSSFSAGGGACEDDEWFVGGGGG
jgi:hypothetical protein